MSFLIVVSYKFAYLHPSHFIRKQKARVSFRDFFSSQSQLSWLPKKAKKKHFSAVDRKTDARLESFFLQFNYVAKIGETEVFVRLAIFSDNFLPKNK